MLLLQF